MDLKAINHVLMNSQVYQKPEQSRFFLSRILGNGMSYMCYCDATWLAYRTLTQGSSSLRAPSTANRFVMFHSHSNLFRAITDVVL